MVLIGTRSRSVKRAAVLTLQTTQRKNRRVSRDPYEDHTLPSLALLYRQLRMVLCKITVYGRRKLPVFVRAGRVAAGSFQLNKDCRFHGHCCEGGSLFVLLAALSCLVFCTAVRCTRQEVIELLIGSYLIVGLRERRNQPGTVCGRTRVAEIIIQFINLFLFHRKPSLSCHQPKVDELRTLRRATAYHVTNRRLMTCARFSVLLLICCTL